MDHYRHRTYVGQQSSIRATRFARLLMSTVLMFVMAMLVGFDGNTGNPPPRQ